MAPKDGRRMVEGRRPRSPSGQKKAQMFVVTMIFLISLVFTVQQLLFHYTDIDLSTPFRENSIYLLKNTKGLINATARSTPDCTDFSTKMQELKYFLDTRAPSTGYVLSLEYTINCANWNNMPPGQAPLNVTISIQGKSSEASSSMYVYHV